MTEQGPTLVSGFLLLALAVAPAILLDSEPWKTIAIVNAATHLVSGFAWTMIGTRFTRPIRDLGLLLWNLTVPVSVALLVAAVFVS